MARKKGGKKSGGPKRSTSSGAAKPFLVAFGATALVGLLAFWFMDVYGWSGAAPSVTLSGWPIFVAIALSACLGVAYWRGGKAVFLGVLAAALLGAWGFFTFVEHALPAPF